MLFRFYSYLLIILAILKTSSSQSLCQAINPPRGGFTHGSETGQSRNGCAQVTANFECRFSCMRGCRSYTNPLPVLTCLSSGAWSQTPPPTNSTCIPDDCPGQSIANSIGCGPTPVGSTCTISCNPGYQLSGPSTLQCLFRIVETQTGLECDRVWQSGPLPVCSPVRCNYADLTQPANGYLDNCQNVGLNQVCRIVCNSGYAVLSNNPNILCTANGWYPQVVPNCEPIRCPTLTPTENLRFINPIECQSGRPSSRCEFACDNGYVLTPRYLQYLECQNGQWSNSGRLPTCGPIQCVDVLDPLYGQKAGKCVNEPRNPVTLTHVCHIICNDGCTFQDGQIRIRLECTNSEHNGGWDRPIPETCLPPSTCPPLYVQSATSCQSMSVGQTCVVNCLPGYQLVGNNFFNCVRNTANVCSQPFWSPNPSGQVCSRVLCPDVPFPVNGQRDGTCVNAGIDDVCTLICGLGYQNPVTGGRQMTAKCQADGRWDGPTECRLITCPPLSPPYNGFYTPVESCTSARPRSSCNFHCNPNFELSPPHLVSDYCREDGTWTNGGIVPTCVETVQCIDVPNPSFAKLTGHCASTSDAGPIRLNSNCTIICYDGCQLSDGSNYLRITCSRLSNTYDWNPPVPQSCLAQSQCPALPPIDFGTGCEPTATGRNCTITCEQGHTLVGNNVLTCMPTTNPNPETCAAPAWLPQELPTCGSLNCPDITELPDGTLTGNCIEANVGQECTVTCNGDGTQSTVICLENGTWSALLECSIPVCPSLRPPENGDFTEDTCAPGMIDQMCNFTCNEGFSLVPPESAQLLCQTGGTWAGDPPECVLIRCEDITGLVIENGGVVSEPSCAERRMNSICNFFCNEGYSMSGLDSTECRADGMWSYNRLPTCTQSIVECPGLTPIDNSAIEGTCSPGQSGQTCTYSCNPGFRLEGDSVFECMDDGNWDKQTPPQCVAVVCPTIEFQPATYEGTCETATPGDKCTVICVNNDRIELTCLDSGEWDGEVTCPSTTCSALTTPNNGQISGDCEQPVLTGECIYTCNEGFNLIGDSPLVCTASGWNKEPPQCVASTNCPDITAPENGETEGQCNPGISSQTCRFSCLEGFRLDGVSEVTCNEEGVWSDEPPVCAQITCPELSPAPEVVMTGTCAPGKPGEKCTLSCNTTPSRVMSILCLPEGTWSDSIDSFSCVQSGVCPPLPLPNGAKTVRYCTPGRVGRRCEIGCGKGFLMEGKNNMLCTMNGQWIGTQAKCLRQCKALSGHNGKLSGQCAPTGLENKFCQLKCSPGFRLVGPRVAQCGANGLWTPTVPRCLRQLTDC